MSVPSAYIASVRWNHARHWWLASFEPMSSALLAQMMFLSSMSRCSVCLMRLQRCLQVDPAGFEISGHIIFKRAKDYETATQDNIWRLLSYASYTEADVLDMARMALAL